MAETRVTRKLAAIVAADMVGYSRLIGLDEAGTITRQKAHRTELIDPKIAECNGRIVKTTGDGLLIEFASAVDAVLCSVAIQRAMTEREADVPEDRRIAYRVGINLGEIVTDGDDILGDGVNVAARLEALAEPGGIRISDAVFQNVKGKLDLGFADLGAQKVKNIADPVSTYRVLLDPEDIGKVIAAKRIASTRMRRVAAAMAAVLVLVVTGVVWWQPWIERVDPARPSKMAFALPTTPSIAVLPFDNLSGDKAQDHLADGLSENIIQALSKATGIFVIARNSTFVYKGKPVKVQQVAEELGVKYVLEGSVQKSGKRIRVTAQLIDAVNGRHLWSERYDRNLSDLFAVQDELTRKIVIALEVELTQGEQARVWHRPTNSLEAWGYVVRGSAQFRRFNKSGNARARELFERAVALDPKYAFAWTLLAWTHVIDAQFGYSTSRAKSFAKAVETAKRALAAGPSEPDAHALLSYIYTIARKYDQAVGEGRKALELGPNMAAINSNVAMTMRFVGNFDEAVRLGERAVRLSPRAAWYVYWSLGTAYALNRQHSKAIATLQQALSRATSDTTKAGTHRALAFAYSEAGQSEKARQHIAALLKINPRFTSQYVRKITFYRNPAHSERVLAALRKAGLPDQPRAEKEAPPLSIVVLPFDNLSSDKSQAYLADAITDQLTTYLARMPGTFVIARNTAFTYKGKAVDVKRVGKELGVRYVLEGSIQVAGEHIRVNAQLINAETGAHLWAETFDNTLRNRLQLQDEIVTRIARSLHLKLSVVVAARPLKDNAGNPDAQVLADRCGSLLLVRAGSVTARRKALSLCRQALKIDPNNARALAILASMYAARVAVGRSKDRTKDIKRANELARRAMAANPDDYVSINAKTWAASISGRHEEAIAAARRGLELNPSHVWAYTHLCAAHLYVGKPEKTIEFAEKAMRLSPRDPFIYSFVMFKGRGLFMLGRDDEAISLLRRSVALNPRNQQALIHLAAVLGAAGRKAEARETLKAFLALKYARSRTIALWKQELRTTNAKYVATFERLTEGLRKAGMPEN